MCSKGVGSAQEVRGKSAISVFEVCVETELKVRGKCLANSKQPHTHLA